MNKLDDLVAPDHPVRLLDALVDRIIGTDTAFFDHLAPQQSAGATRLGRSLSYSPEDTSTESTALESCKRKPNATSR